MERRDDVLKQALDKNADETERWETFKVENEVAIRNIDMFSKKLTVEVMVPIGNKALMPGQLIHTNELLVGHYQDYFSACSAHKAKEICQHRLRLAEDHLDKLKVEAVLWQNKLEKPLLEGALPSGGEIEIVEDYVEEDHNLWLKKHKESVRKQKQKERIERESVARGEQMFRELEDRDLIEELGLSPDLYDEEKLIEMITKDTEKQAQQTENTVTNEEVFEMLEKLEAIEENEETEMDEESEHNMQSTNYLVSNLMRDQQKVKTKPATNFRIVIEDNINKKPSEDADSTDEDEPDQLQEVKTIRKQVAQLPNEEQEAFLCSQIEILKSKMRNMQKENFINDELTHLMNVVVCLEDDLQEMIFDDEQAASTDALSDVDEITAENIKNRRISFAKTDEKLIFRKEESVAQMMPKKRQQSRDVIALDGPLKPIKKALKVREPVVKSEVLQKVEKNVDFVQQHQSVQDFDLVNQILEAATGQINTLHISFTHSNAEAAVSQFNANMPGNPADFYNLYKQKQAAQEKPIFVHSFEGEEQLKVPIIKEEARKTAYDDPRAEFSKLPEEPSQMETKSILPDKAAVDVETPSSNEVQLKPKPPPISKSKKNRNKKKKKQRTVDDELRDMSAYQKVMQDLVEKEEPTEPKPEPEPLPKGKFINANAPKKRVSRFKEQRSKKTT